MWCKSFCVWLISMFDIFQYYPCCCKLQNFIPSYGCVILIVCTHHIFLIHSLIDRCLGWFYLLVMNCATINVDLHYLFDKMIPIWLPWSHGIFICSFWKRNCCSISTMAVLAYIHTNCVKQLPFPHILARNYINLYTINFLEAIL
jgi:hypothetical protein